VDEDVKKKRAGRIAGLLAILVLLIVIGGGVALWLTAIRAPEPSSPAAAVSEPGTVSIQLAWDKSPSDKVTGYRIMIGARPGDYTDTVNVGNEGSVTLTNLKKGTKYYIVAVALDAEGNKSAPSNEIEVVTPN
jgi:hypothetical protein